MANLTSRVKIANVGIPPRSCRKERAKSGPAESDAKADIVVLKQRPPYEGQHHSGHGDPNHS